MLSLMRAGGPSRGSSILRATATPAALVLLAGCGGQPTACTDIGADSGVFFNFSKVLRAHPGEALRVRACVRKTCQTVRVGRHRRQTEVGVGSDALKEGSPIGVNLTISTPKGEVVFRAGVRVIPALSQPNGASCPPSAWVATLSASGRRHLQQTNASA
jgi:hypothetical protein